MNRNDKLNLLRHIYMSALQEHQMREFFEAIDSPDDLHQLEHDPRIKTSLTDKDMLLLHIDMALDAGDVDAFMRLTKGLNEMEVSA